MTKTLINCVLCYDININSTIVCQSTKHLNWLKWILNKNVPMDNAYYKKENPVLWLIGLQSWACSALRQVKI